MSMQMTESTLLSIFDGHNDALQFVDPSTDEGRLAFFTTGTRNHLDLQRARRGGFGGGFFAVAVPPDPQVPRLPRDGLTITADGYEMPLPPPLDPSYAQHTIFALTARLFQLEAASDGQLKVVRTVDELAACLRNGVVAAVFHIEGAEAIDPELHLLDVLYQAGLRSLGPVWSRPNAFGTGVPFRYPRSPDTGDGLTAAGVDLVRACNRLGIMLDVSHLNERGFWDMAALSDSPLVVTHSNVHALCRSTRNLTDKQLDAIGESDGMVGVAFDVSMLREDGHLEPDTPLPEIVRHVDYLVERIGIDRVGFGSDFDGATMPRDLPDVAALPALIDAFRARGYDEPALRKLAWENWLRVLGATWR
jgi:membrane dipeptidase